MNLLQRLLLRLGRKGWLDNMDDAAFLKMSYWCYFSKKLDLVNPKTYTERLQWLQAS